MFSFTASGGRGILPPNRGWSQPGSFFHGDHRLAGPKPAIIRGAAGVHRHRIGRTRMVEKIQPITRQGLAKIEQELQNLETVRRREVAEKIHQAKELSNTQNNAEYEDAKNEQAMVEGRIAQ